MITVSHLSRHFVVHTKAAGFGASFKSLFKRNYSVKKAVDDISFSIDEGELVGFIGPNGAGKTTTLKMLAGLLYPTSGQVEVMGFTPFDRKAEFLRRISLVMGQKNQLWYDLPPTETFLLNKEIYQVPDAQYKETVDTLVELLEVGDALHTQVRRLSLGQRMKCELIAALIQRPKILFLDEPTIGLDVIMQKKLRKFIKQYNKQYSSTILLTSHYMDDVKELCKRVIIINYGKILYDGSLDELNKQFSTHKYISIKSLETVDTTKLSSFGELTEQEDGTYVIKVPSTIANEALIQILSHVQGADITIQDTRLEDVIREVFKRHHFAVSKQPTV